MWLKDLIYKWFFKKPTDPEDFLKKQQVWAREYFGDNGYNVRKIASITLSNIVIGDSTLTISGDTPRSEWLSEQVVGFWDKKLPKALSDALGVGGVYVVPYIANGKVCTDVVPQSQVIVSRRVDDLPVDISILNEIRTVDDRKYARVTNHYIEDGKYVVKVKCVDDSGRQLPLAAVPEWGMLTEEFSIAGMGSHAVDRLPIAYLSSPRTGQTMTGEPITAGLDGLIDQIGSVFEDFFTEYKNKKAFIGAADLLFDADNKLPKSGLFKKLSAAGAADGETLWEVFDPAIRDASYTAGLDYLFSKLETGIGVSGGIFTKLSTHGATATEIKSANYNTYMLLHDCRSKIKAAIETLCYGLSLWADALQLAPAGAYEIGFDWDYSLFESSSETWAQLRDAKASGAVSTVELRQYIKPEESIEQAEQAVDQIKANEPTLSQLGF